MKKLLLLRHAKSDKSGPTVVDFDRPLNDRGEKAAVLIGSFIGKRKIQPELVVSSPAERARQTAMFAVKAAGLDVDLRFDERIYEASASQLLSVVKQIDEGVSVALLVGHNPGFESLLSDLSGLTSRMPTAALASLNMSIDAWSDAEVGCAELKWMVTPKDLEGDMSEDTK